MRGFFAALGITDVRARRNDGRKEGWGMTDEGAVKLRTELKLVYDPFEGCECIV
jgi:hypothetical protein